MFVVAQNKDENNTQLKNTNFSSSTYLILSTYLNLVQILFFV